MGKKSKRGKGKVLQQEKLCPLCGTALDHFVDWGTYTSGYECPRQQCSYLEEHPMDALGKKDGVASYGYFGGGGAYVMKCRHWRQAVKVRSYTVTCSSYLSDKPIKTDAPDFGVYLASCWESKFGRITSTGALLNDLPRPYQALFVDWPDMGVIETDVVQWLVDWIEAKLEHGKKVDIGCMGGHGRTGTLLACLIAQMEHVGSVAATEAVHARYCTHAIETDKQRDFIRKFCGEPELPKSPVAVQTVTPVSQVAAPPRGTQLGLSVGIETTRRETFTWPHVDTTPTYKWTPGTSAVTGKPMKSFRDLPGEKQAEIRDKIFKAGLTSQQVCLSKILRDSGVAECVLVGLRDEAEKLVNKRVEIKY